MSLPINTVMPAAAEAAANVRVEVTCKETTLNKLEDKKQGIMDYWIKCLSHATVFIEEDIL